MQMKGFAQKVANYHYLTYVCHGLIRGFPYIPIYFHICSCSYMFPIQWAILCSGPSQVHDPLGRLGNAADGMTDLFQRAVEAGGQDIVQDPREVQQAHLQKEHKTQKVTKNV